MFACGQCLLSLSQIIAILSACSLPILCNQVDKRRKRKMCNESIRS